MTEDAAIDKSTPHNGPEYWRGYIDGMKYIHLLYKTQGRLLPEPLRKVSVESTQEED